MLAPALMRCDKHFQNFRRLKLRLHFCVDFHDFHASSELIGYVDLMDSYEIWPKCSLVINSERRQKCMRLFRYSKCCSFYALSYGEDQQMFNPPSSKYIFSATNQNIEKASHTFVIYDLLIDIVQFVWSCRRPGRQVIHFSEQRHFCF